MEKIIKNIKLFLILLIFSIGFILIGALFNTLAINSNGCKMPVLTNQIYSIKTHFSYQNNNQVNNYILTDRIVLGNSIYSIGDLLMIFGYIFMCISSLFILINLYKIEKIIKEEKWIKIN